MQVVHPPSHPTEVMLGVGTFSWEVSVETLVAGAGGFGEKDGATRWLKEAACLCRTCSRSEPGAIAFYLALGMGMGTASCRTKPSVCPP